MQRRRAYLPSISSRAKLPRLGVVRLGVKDGGGRPREVGHFILDIEDGDLRAGARALYGEKPRVLEIAFFSNDMTDLYRSMYQRWVGDKKGVSRLMCEGNGMEAVSGGRQCACPCPYLGRECQRKSVLKFLLPGLTMAGHFLLATRSDNNSDNIETGLRLILRATGGLIMREALLRRTEGYAEVNGVRTRKFYVALEGQKALAAQKGASAADRVLQEGLPCKKEEDTGGITAIGALLKAPDASSLARQEELRVRRGRRRVKEMVQTFIMEPGAQRAVERYACMRFSKRRFEDLTGAELQELWCAIDDDLDATRTDIYTIFMGMNR